MSFETDFDTAFTILLGKAAAVDIVPGSTGGGTTSTATTTPASANFVWSGGGQPIDASLTDPLLCEIPFAGRLVWAHLYAGDGAGNPSPATTTVQVRLTRLDSFGNSRPFYGTGSAPGLSSSSTNNIDISQWLQNFDAGDAILAYPTSFAGTATWLALSLQLRPVEQTSALTVVTDNALSPMLDANGNVMEFRS